jgi:hypothetical protein
MSSGAAIFAPPHRKITSSDLRQKPQSINENKTETSQSQTSFQRTSFISAANRIRSTRIAKVLPTATKILPTVGHKLSDWLEFPADEGRHSVIVNSFTLPFKWLLFTSKGLAGLPPGWIACQYVMSHFTFEHSRLWTARASVQPVFLPRQRGWSLFGDRHICVSHATE